MRLVQATKSLIKPEEWEGRRVTFQPEGKLPYRVPGVGSVHAASQPAATCRR
jgi:hypothetical protein